MEDTQKVSDIAAFLNARLDEVEAVAKRTAEIWPFGSVDSAVSIPGDGPLFVWAHVTGHDPRRVLREVAAGRAILARHVAVQAWSYPPGDGDEAVQDELGTVIRHLAAVYSDHLDYDQEWKP